MRQRIDFLASLRAGNSISKACAHAGISRGTAYYWRKEDVEFDEAWKDAIDSSNEELEDHLRARALDPEDRSGHLLLMFLLKKINPEYRDNYVSKAKKAVQETKEFEFDAKEIDAAMKILDAAKHKAKVPQNASDE